MKKNMVSLAVATTLGLTALAASAEDMYRGAWYAVPGVSWMHPDSDLDAKGDNEVGAFIKLGKELSPSWDIQGGLTYNRANEDLDIPGADGRYKQYTLGVDALYMFSRDKFRPFLLAGLGVARNEIDYSVPAHNVGDDKTSWMANVGLGAQYLFSDKFGLQADLRHQWSRAKSEISGPTYNGSETDTIGNTIFNLGAIFRFGAPVPVAVAEPPLPEVAPVAPPPEPEPTPEPIVAPPPCEPKFETITMQAEKLFGFDKYKLTNDAVAELDNVVATLNAHPEFDVVVVSGHTDRIGSEAYNQKLSEKRADAIKDHLISHGIDANRIRAVGKGESQPLVECNQKNRKQLIECLAPNRRVEIHGERLHPTNECE